MTQELRPLTPEQEAEVRASIHQGWEPELLFMLDASRAERDAERVRNDALEDAHVALNLDLDASRAAHQEALARAERAEARCAALGTDPSVPMEQPSVLATMAERLGTTERERDEAQAALVALREVYEQHGAAGVSAALAATPASLAGQQRARVLREAAKHGEEDGRSCWWLLELADEAEKGTDR